MLRSLDPTKIVETAERLQRRIEERFPGSGLSHVAAELHTVARESLVRADTIRQPRIGLRMVSGLLVVGILAVLIGLVVSLRRSGELYDLLNFVQFLEAALGSLVFVGAAILFLVSLEIRLKRRRALQAIHELRSIAHIVDMHQLTKDPERIVRGPSTPSSPQRTMTTYQLTRYLDYCTELLAIISKIAAIYVQDFPDDVALEAVDQVENLTTGLSRKIWQKLMILDQMIGEREETDILTAEIPVVS